MHLLASRTRNIETMQAIGKHILVKKLVSKEKDMTSATGMLLQNMANDQRYGRGEVISPGTEVTCVKSGDEIYYDKRVAFTILLKGEEVTVIREVDVILIVS
jgi:co-chaperonin GroES (HSP10)